MHVLSISLDTSIATEDGDARQRQFAYADHFDRYTVIVKTDAGEGVFLQEESLEIVPTRSSNRYRFPWDAYQETAKRCQEAEVDVITVQSPFVTGLIGWLIAQRFDIRLHTQVHTDFLSNPNWRRSNWEHRLFAILGRFVLSQSDAVRVGTEIEQQKTQSLVGEGTSVFLSPVKMDLNSLTKEVSDREREELRSDLGVDDRPIVLFAGRFVRAKNLRKWLGAAKRVHEQAQSNPAFVLVGDGPLRDEIVERASELGLRDDTFFPGWVDEDRLGKYYKISGVFLITSQYEGTSRVIVEAGKNELPVVSTPFAGALANIVDGETGYVAEEEEELAQYVTRIIEDPALRMKLGSQATEYLADRFDSQRLIEKYIDFLQSDVQSALASEGKQSDSPNCNDI